MEQLPEEWNKAIIVPLHKKGDKLNCNNYREISLLNTAYKVFSKVLLGRLQPFTDECIGEYQCGFRKGKSTINQLSVIGQIIEKKFEYKQNMWQVFVYFKKVYYSIHRESFYNIMYEFGFPSKEFRLIKRTVRYFFEIRVYTFMNVTRKIYKYIFFFYNSDKLINLITHR